ncbi:uncharacterized protein si:ch1073-126c3.2 [Callorhinchus milii]|uniref:Uncharacterized LOC103182389 n=1 Tax=Callorhinchus milii TaxID=7868 RepID=A0A4W3I2D3_CALMI|nr:uncharacterized protein si:ch1073-126c3.2 [Callorhinchus milii]|eukprot:gi/632937181/ref/XP_007897579.1/ PREDICTED: uncharacterized protein LOC103182389 [Callorhinchus milii]
MVCQTVCSASMLLALGWFLIAGTGSDHTEENHQCLFTAKNYTELANSLKLITEQIDQITGCHELEQRTEIYALLQNTADKMRAIRIRACHKVSPKNCSIPLVPNNGGLMCLTLNKTRYCKPMCNQEADFNFLRKSRLFESCGESTQYQWTTQYVGGSRLAQCSVTRMNLHVSGDATAYFRSTCHQALLDYENSKMMMNNFKKELQAKGIVGKIKNRTECLMCGNISV